MWPSVAAACVAAVLSATVRLILPSFGAYTGGLDVGETAIAALFAGPFHAYMLGHSRVYAIPRRLCSFGAAR